jgi:hypothetical protein
VKKKEDEEEEEEEEEVEVDKRINVKRSSSLNNSIFSQINPFAMPNRTIVEDDVLRSE